MPGGAPHAGADRRGPAPRGGGAATLPVLAVRPGAVRRHPSGRPRRPDPALQVRGGGAGGGDLLRRPGGGADALPADPATAAFAAGGTGLPRARVAAPRRRGCAACRRDARAAAAGGTATDREPRARAGDARAAPDARRVRGLGGAPRHRRCLGGAGARAVLARGGGPALDGPGAGRARAGPPLCRCLSRRSGARRPRAAPRRRWASTRSGGCSGQETQARAG